MANGQKKVPLRKCIGCGAMKEKRELIRVVKTPEGEFIVDHSGKANGRGAYLCSDQKCMALASKGRGLEKSFHGKVTAETYDLLKGAIQ